MLVMHRCDNVKFAALQIPAGSGSLALRVFSMRLDEADRVWISFVEAADRLEVWRSILWNKGATLGQEENSCSGQIRRSASQEQNLEYRILRNDQPIRDLHDGKNDAHEHAEHGILKHPAPVQRTSVME